MAGMWIVHVDVKDDERYAEYVEGSTQVASQYGGEFIARGGRYQQKEGRDPTCPRHTDPPEKLLRSGETLVCPRCGVRYGKSG